MSEVARHGQAQVVNDFMDQLLAADPDANAIVLGDINDFEFSETVDILEGDGALLGDQDAAGERALLVRLRGQLAGARPDPAQRTIYSGHFPYVYDVVHVNSEFATRRPTTNRRSSGSA